MKESARQYLCRSIALDSRTISIDSSGITVRWIAARGGDMPATCTVRRYPHKARAKTSEPEYLPDPNGTQGAFYGRDHRRSPEAVDGNAGAVVPSIESRNGKPEAASDHFRRPDGTRTDEPWVKSPFCDIAPSSCARPNKVPLGAQLHSQSCQPIMLASWFLSGRRFAPW